MIHPTTAQRRKRLQAYTSVTLNQYIAEYLYRVKNRSTRSMLYVGLIFADKVDVQLAEDIVKKRKGKNK